MRRRILLYAALALLAPLPALAALGDSEPAPPTELSVGVELGGCSLAGGGIACRLEITHELLPGAERYTASVARPDGSVVELGAIGAGAASAWVGYAGDGVYRVEVSAYGSPEGPGEPATLLDRERAAADRPDPKPSGRDADGPARAAGATAPSNEGHADAPGAPEALAPEEPGSPTGEPGEGTDAGGEQGGEPPAPSSSTDPGCATEAGESPDAGRYDGGDGDRDCGGALGAGA